jgi:molybdate transport repressor ModE-like protein
MGMTKVLDIVPLRSLITVADAGGFHRAAAELQLSQSAVSQHIRRLEKVLGQPLVEPDGRGARLTPVGEALLTEARQIVAAHDDALARLTAVPSPRFVIGTTDHAADHILPPVVSALGRSSPGLEVKFRFDRTTSLNDAVERGSIDLAVVIAESGGITEPGGREGIHVGALRLAWCAAPGWSPPSGQPWPLIALEEPCAIRGRALAVLGRSGIPVTVVAEAAYLAGVLNAARAGLGITLVALAGPVPEGLVEVRELPATAPIGLTVRTRRGTNADLAATAVRALRETLQATAGS